MPSYTLHYFNHRGRAEICRMLFAAAGVQYNDRRIDSSEWDNMRNKMPCNMMPMLELDNRTQIPQSMAMARYLAREFGFYGQNNMDMARIDFISECFYDILDDYMRMYQDSNCRMMFQRSRDFGGSSSNMYFVSKIFKVKTCVDPDDILFGISMADMMCYCALENPMMENSSFLSSYPKLMALRERVMNHSKLSNYLQRRCQTDF